MTRPSRFFIEAMGVLITSVANAVLMIAWGCLEGKNRNSRWKTNIGL